MRDVFCSLMMVLLNAFCISSICLRYLSNANVKTITAFHCVNILESSCNGTVMSYPSIRHKQSKKDKGNEISFCSGCTFSTAEAANMFSLVVRMTMNMNSAPVPEPREDILENASYFSEVLN